MTACSTATPRMPSWRFALCFVALGALFLGVGAQQASAAYWAYWVNSYPGATMTPNVWFQSTTNVINESQFVSDTPNQLLRVDVGGGWNTYPKNRPWGAGWGPTAWYNATSQCAVSTSGSYAFGYCRARRQ